METRPEPAITARLTPRRVPEAYLRAEIAAFPLASEESFRLGLVSLDPRLREGHPTRRLWRACEGLFAAHTGWSLDRMVTARDRGWFGERPGTLGLVPMHRYLATLARSHLTPRAGVTTVAESLSVTSLDAADHYRWLSFTMPEDLLLAALGVDPPPTRVEDAPPLLVRRLSDLGMAEVHHHVGAGMSFPLLWASALAALLDPRVRGDALRSPGAPFADGARMVHWLLAAAVARSVLAAYLAEGVHRTAYTAEPAPDHDFHRFLGGADRACPEAPWLVSVRDGLARTLRALAHGEYRALPELERLQDLYADLHPGAGDLLERPPESVADVYRRCDPIALQLGLEGSNAGERWLLRQGLRYLEQRSEDGTPDWDFACVFWQVLRVRCQYYRMVVERPLTGGLQWFIRFYSRLGTLRGPLTRIQPEVSYETAGDGERIGALELRHSAPDTAIGVAEDVLRFLESWRRVLRKTSSSMFEPELGLVYHFVKSRDPEEAWPHGVPAAFWTDTYAEPERMDATEVDRGRYAGFFASQCRPARAVAELIERVPSVLWVLRGLDVARDEMGVPTWVLVPLFRYLVDVSARESVRRSEGAGPPLRLTAHVGEDFRHLAEGMRRIYEQVHYVLGDVPGRLGHALALGVEPRGWAESVGSVLMPAEQRLWDLVWEWRLYTRHRIRPEYAAWAPEGRIEEVVTEARELAELIHGEQRLEMADLAEAHHVLHSFMASPQASREAVQGQYDTFLRVARGVRAGRMPGVQRPGCVGGLLERFLADESVFLRGQRLVDVQPAREVDALVALQNALRRGIAANGIVVEVTPSSNLLIGDMLDLRNHPILRLFPPLRDEDAPPPVPIALGSDDPVIFSTRLVKEYTLLYQTALSAGYPARVVQEWLEAIRSTGMDARFTLVWSPSARKKTESLIAALRAYLLLPEGPGTCRASELRVPCLSSGSRGFSQTSDMSARNRTRL